MKDEVKDIVDAITPILQEIEEMIKLSIPIYKSEVNEIILNKITDDH